MSIVECVVRHTCRRDSMKYMLMLFEPDIDWEALPEAEREAGLREHEIFVQYMRERRVQFSGAALGGQSTATTVHRAEDKTVFVTDGPYVELKEALAGIYIIDVRDLDEALEVARRCPAHTATEVRPILDLGMGDRLGPQA
jgi:hypothetical protein